MLTSYTKIVSVQYLGLYLAYIRGVEVEDKMAICPYMIRFSMQETLPNSMTPRSYINQEFHFNSYYQLL